MTDAQFCLMMAMWFDLKGVAWGAWLWLAFALINSGFMQGFFRGLGWL